MLLFFPPPANRNHFLPPVKDFNPFCISWWIRSSLADYRHAAGATRWWFPHSSGSKCAPSWCDVWVSATTVRLFFSLIWVAVFFPNRGDPTLVKTNVAITTGYLISGKWRVMISSLLIGRRGAAPSWKENGTSGCSIRELTPLFSFCLSVFPDLLLIFYYWKAIGDKFFVIHHLAALYAYYYVLVSALLSNSRLGAGKIGGRRTKGEQLRPAVPGVGKEKKNRHHIFFLFSFFFLYLFLASDRCQMCTRRGQCLQDLSRR